MVNGIKDRRQTERGQESDFVVIKSGQVVDNFHETCFSIVTCAVIRLICIVKVVCMDVEIKLMQSYPFGTCQEGDAIRDRYVNQSSEFL